jgi:Protein of unknown function (DUF1264)
MPKLMPELGVQAAERQALLSLQKTYGKTWHTWQVDRFDSLPYGTLLYTFLRLTVNYIV